MTLEEAIDFVERELPGAELRLRAVPLMKSKIICLVMAGGNVKIDRAVSEIEIRVSRGDAMGEGLREAVSELKLVRG